jgi:quinol monooxygenase YgiN
MKEDKVHICALIRAKPGQEDKLKAALVEVVQKTQREPGCLLFQIHEFEHDPCRFMLWECFENFAALEAHMATDYTREYFENARKFMAEPTQVTRLRKIV